MINKAILRQQFLQRRISLFEEESQKKNDAIYRLTKNVFKVYSKKTVHVFLPQPEKNEVDTWKLVRWFWANLPKSQIVAPYVIPGTFEMEHYELNKNTPLILNRWKIPEPDPVKSKKIHEDQIDAVLVPLLIFDKKGYRVGYGGGYYDRFLKKCRPDTVKIGVSFFEPVDEIGDLDAHDVPLNMCITPEYVYRF
ncbi:5-formyltetrahydrofolate cyclo-ligase [Dyadobacter sp. CY323]|uniref:5-formyltetrahydrofolate cyclo-ligase n=1 Tax=Dyadobacter sp. CY323 TaxID=2907302 RepID=UPI001F3A3BD3|nr:5-formyltetrahydrofolate cyclo-ligase [Dyadobacter sp. CY323]MCE6990710.1 5-formyltetrahydrofolate cyclo-ligase [Dyadobacter sp. CY323]